MIRVRLRFHERVHQWWDMIAGPLHPVLYGLLFLFIFSLQGFRDWRKAYRRNPFEKQARELAKAASEGPETWGYYA